jgi:AraC-like DNA-binding protein
MAYSASNPASVHSAYAVPPVDARQGQERLELVALLARLTGEAEGAIPSAIPGLVLYRVLRSQGPRHVMQNPSFAVIAQGSKRLIVGDEVYQYDPLHYLVSSVDLPVSGCVTNASAAQPYLGLRLDLDVAAIAELIQDQALPALPEPETLAGARPPAAGNLPWGGGAERLEGQPLRGVYVNHLGATMLDVVLRLLRLLETPRDIPILAPMIKRELLYRLLMNGQGAHLRQIALQDSHAQRIAKAIRLLRANFAQALPVEALAREVHMSVSSLHHHFKAVTALSPLQYQKQLRLQEARRLILAEGVEVSMAAHQVGYESASQFSREYSRLFGIPPSRDKRQEMWTR